MKLKWLFKNQKEKLLLIFSGFAMDESSFTGLQTKEYDVAVLCDYRDLNFEFNENQNYKELHILGFSLGVWVFSQLQEIFSKIDSITVINGTCKPISENCGISPEIFRGTVNNFNEKGKLKFLRRMFVDKEDFQNYTKNLAEANVVEQKEELSFLMEEILSFPEKKIKPDKIYISLNDRIIPAISQKKYWHGFENCIFLEEGHFPFFNFKYLDKLVGLNDR